VQYGAAVVSHVNFAKDRVEPNFSIDLGMGAQLYRKESRSLQFQIQATNIADRLNVINFAAFFPAPPSAPPAASPPASASRSSSLRAVDLESVLAAANLAQQAQNSMYSRSA